MSDRIRLRPAHDAEALARIYAKPHDHTAWEDHLLRVAVTAQFAHTIVGHVATAADLSCGDGAVLKALDVETRYFGDFAPGYQFIGPIDETIHQIPTVDLFVCCETLEHLDDPDRTLSLIRDKTTSLVLSTPVGAFGDQNPEHYWAWDREAVEEMLTAAGFSVVAYASIDCRPSGGHYNFGVWYCR